MTDINQYLDKRLMLHLEAETRDEVIRQMIESAYLAKKIPGERSFYDAILAREQVVSTGIGMGVALPHAKTAELDGFFVVVAVVKKGVDWDALDGAPVRLVFMIGGPDDKQTEYLQVLSGLTNAIKDEERRKQLLSSRTADDILTVFSRLGDL